MWSSYNNHYDYDDIGDDDDDDDNNNNNVLSAVMLW